MSVGAVLAQVRNAVDALAGLEVGAFADGELDELVAGLELERQRLTGATRGVLAEWDERRVWEWNGSRTAGHRLARVDRSSVDHARAEIARARAGRRCPLTAAAVVEGVLSVDQFAVITAANTPARAAVCAGAGAMLVRESARLDLRGTRIVIQRWCETVDELLDTDRAHERERCLADGTDPEPCTAPLPHADARLFASRSFEGRLVIDGDLDPIGAEIVTNELRRLEQRLCRTDKRAGITRTPAQRRAAALIEMATRSATAPANGRRPRPLFSVTVGHDTMARLCSLASGTLLGSGDLVPHLDTAMLETVLFADHTTILSVSRQRTFRGALRRAIQVRDQHCQHPSGCDIPADQCDIDHIVPYAEGGLTSQFGGDLGCDTHNRLAHLRHTGNHTARPHRTIDRLDELRARIRWRIRQHEHREQQRERQQPQQQERTRPPTHGWTIRIAAW
jgi:hypothetical protein